jgi:hypothetical protein
VDETRWREALKDHEAAVTAFLDGARRVPADRWDTARPGDKWSPGQIAEHLRLTYATLRRDLEGGTGFRVRVSPLRALVYRVTVLRRMLRRRQFVKGAPATREVRPAGGPFERQATLAGLQAEAAAFEATLGARGGPPERRVAHPFFGRLSPLQGLELCALHTRHHGEQLLEATAPAADTRSPPPTAP